MLIRGYDLSFDSQDLTCSAVHLKVGADWLREGGGSHVNIWELREGKVLVVEDANTASLVVVARDLKDRNDKVAVLEEILRRLQA